MLSRIPYFVLVLICLIVVASKLATGANQPASTTVVKDLLAAVQRGDINAARLMLGDNTCNCPPRGGWVSLFKYESGHEPNLAFLLKGKFAVSNISNESIQVAHNYVFPWDKPEDRKVDLNIRFLTNLPYFLPLKLAFGMPMQETEFKQWRNTFENEAPHSKGPSHDAPLREAPLASPRVFTLRLRNSLKPGTIAQVQPDKRESLLPPSVRAYIHPRDCAQVLDEHSKPWTEDALVRQLPRLQSVHVSFTVVSRGILSPWTIKSAKFTDPEWLH